MGTLLFFNAHTPMSHNLISAILNSVTSIWYYPENETLESLIQRVPPGTYTRVGILQENRQQETYTFLDSFGNSNLSTVETNDPQLTTWFNFSQFLQRLKTYGMTHLDFIECNLGTPSWKYVTDRLTQQLDITISYTNNLLGQEGTWILETDPTIISDDVALIGLYFNDTVQYYQGTLGTSGGLNNGDPNYRGPIHIINPAGVIYSWGSNYFGSFGIGFVQQQYDAWNPYYHPTPYLPAPVFPSPAVAVSGSDVHTIAVLANGTVYGAGQNVYGQTGSQNGYFWGNNQAYWAGSQSPWYNFVQIPGIINAVDVACSYAYSLILLRNGTVMSMGLNYSGQLAINSAAFTSVEYNNYSSAIVQSILPEPIVGVYANHGSSFFLGTSGYLYAAGDNWQGRLGLGTLSNTNSAIKITQSTFKTVSIGDGYSLALDLNGNLWGTGRNDLYQQGRGNTIDTDTFQQITSSTVYKSVSAGWTHAGAVDTNNRVWMWGQGTNGGLGNGSANIVTVPTLSSITNVYSIIYTGMRVTVLGILDNGNIRAYSAGLNTASRLREPYDEGYQSYTFNAMSLGEFILPTPTIQFQFTLTTSATSFTPVAGTFNTSVSLAGSNLSNTSFVFFGNTSAPINLITGTLVNVSAPANSGNVSIVLRDNTGANVSMPGNFTYQNPSVTSFTPVAAAQNASISLSGTNLSNTSFVRFGLVNASINLRTGTLVNVSAPVNSGNVSIVLRDNLGNEVTMPGSFTYQNPAATSFTPVAGTLNTSVSLSGTNLSNTVAVRFGLVNASINLSSGTLVNVSVPANTGNVSIALEDNVGNIATMPGSFTYQNPSVTSFTPVAGTLNTSVSLSGSNLSNTSYVLFGNTSATINLRTGTLVNVSAPANSGNVSIVLRDNLGNNVSMPGSFSYQNPSVTSFTPVAAAQNATISLSGTNLSNTRFVRFGLVNASINLSSGTLVNVSVPANESSNVSIALEDNVGNIVTMPGSFTYQNPSVTSFTPVASATNTSLTLSGENLSNTSYVLFGLVNASINSITGSRVNVSVPSNSGNVSIVLIDNVGNNVSAPGSFTYQNLRITALNPAAAAKNTRINISGEKLDNATSVRIGGISTIFTINSSVAINASVPNSSGNVSVAITDDIGNEVIYDGLFEYQNLNITSVFPLYGTTNTSVTFTGSTLTNRSTVKFGDQTATINRTTATSINVSAPANSGNVSIYILDNDGNQIEYPEQFLYQNPSLTTVTPLFGTKNTIINLTGTNLMNISSVRVGTTNAAYTINSSLSINASIPAGNGNVSIQLRDNVSNLISYPDLFSYQNPSAISFSPSTGTRNTTVTLTGENLSNTSYVLFSNERASIQSITGTTVNVSAPTNTVNTNSIITIVDTVGNNVSMATRFVYQNPTVTSFRNALNTSVGTKNTSITIVGTHLSNTSYVLFGDQNASINLRTANSINVSVPENEGNVSIRVQDNVGNELTVPNTFIYQNPSLTSFTPLAGTNNVSVSLSGTFLNNTDYVLFGSQLAPLNIRSATLLNVSAPANSQNVSIFVVDRLGNQQSMPGTFLYQNPSIEDITPKSGTKNTSVTILGSNLANISNVKIRTTNASYRINSSTSINVSIPVGIDGNASIELRDHVSNVIPYSGNFVYQNASATQFNSVGTKNTSVTITGSNLSNTSSVLFGTNHASVNLVTGTAVNVSVPANIINANVSIFIRDNLGNSITAPGNFTYQNPSVTSVTPLTGTTNTVITITGINLNNTSFVNIQGESVPFTVNTSRSVSATVNASSGNASIVLVDNVGNNTSFAGNFAYVNTTVGGFSPQAGTRNTSVTITGSNMTNTSYVYFGETNASINLRTANSVNVSAPVNEGNVSIRVVDKYDNELYLPDSFTYQNLSVTEFSPQRGTTNTSVSLSGYNLSNIRSVRFGGTNASINLSSGTLVNVSAPVKADGSYPIVLRDHLGNEVTMSQNFTYQNPSGTGFNVSVGTNNTSVTITGTNLSNTSSVKFGTANASINLITGTFLNVSAPATSGNVSIVVRDNIGNNVSLPGSFVYQNPTITRLLPLTGSINTAVTINGSNLSNTVSVKFGGVNATIVSNTSTMIQTLAPDISGNVSVVITDPLGNNTSFSGNFAYQNTTITGFTPTVGIRNTPVVVTGTFLNNISTIRFGTVNAPIRSKTATTLNVSAPLNTGNVSIFFTDILGNSLTAHGTFSYQYPTITSIEPLEGTTNTVLQITGTNLGNTKSVKIGTTTITKFISKTTTDINLSVLKSTGNVSVVLVDQSGLNTSFTGNFAYKNQLITSVAPLFGLSQTPVTITGNNLSNTSYVKFGTAFAQIQSQSNTALSVLAPALTGRATITVGDIFKNVISYNIPFLYQTTTISSVVPLSGTKNTPMVIIGTNLSNISYVTFGNVSTEAIINSSVSIRTTVPDSTGSVTVSVVDNMGKITSFSRKFAFTSTTITSMNTSGIPKATIQIRGTNLANTSVVNFDNTSASFKAFPTYINATVPFGYGNVSVEVIDRHGNSTMAPGNFLFKTPAITQISSDSSPINTTITIYGMNLINTSYVSFGTTITRKLTKTTNSVNVSVPPGSGNVSLKVTDTLGNDILFPRNFMYQNTFISSVTPRIAPPKSTVSLEGGYLSNTSFVIFGTQNTSFEIVNNGLINASVPSSSGNVSVSVRDNLGILTTYNELFTYKVMTITSFEPTTGVKNTKITVEGTDFDSIDTVKLGTTNVSFTLISNYQMEVIVPEITGPKQLVISDEYGNTVTSSQSFSQKTPTITEIDKVSGLIGETLTIYGTDLADMKYVVFGTEQAEDEVVTDTQITCTIPYGLGEVTIQVSDNLRNTLTVPDTFTYIQNIPEPNLVLENAPSFTTIDSSNNIYTSTGSIVNKTYTVNGTQVTEVFYTNTRPISGIALDKGILYMCEYEFNDIVRYNTNTNVKLSYQIDPADRVQPNIIKVYKNKLYAICNADPDTTDPDYLYVFDLSTNAVYKKDLLPAYTIQGLAHYNDAIYMSAVIKNSPALGRVISTQLNGTLINEALITGLDNPIDLTFVNDLLTIDGRSVIVYNINNVTTPLATYQSSPTSEYNSVFAGTDSSGNNVIYMTNTTTNQIETVPAPSVLTNDILATQITPTSGSENTHAVIQGQNFLDANNSPKIKKVMFGATESTNLSIVSNTLLYCDVPYGSGKVSIQLIDMSDQTIATSLYFTYQKPTILSSYPKQGLEGENLYLYGPNMNLVSNILIGTVDASFTLMRRDTIRITVPPGSGIELPITLIDQLNNTITNEAFKYTYYVFNSTICFPAGTLVQTDQGTLPIQKLVPGLHSLNQHAIVAITDTYSMDKELVCIEQDALGLNYPTELTLISPRHKINYAGLMMAAYRLVGMKGVSFVSYGCEKLYNVLLEEYSTMEVQGLVCETLHPDNPVAKMYRLKLTEQR